MQDKRQLIERFFSGTATEAEKKLVESLRKSDPDFELDFKTEATLRSVQQRMRHDHLRTIINQAWQNRPEDLPAETARPVTKFFNQPLRFVGFALLALACIGVGYLLLCKQVKIEEKINHTPPASAPAQQLAPVTHSKPIAVATDEEPQPVQKQTKASRKVSHRKKTQEVAGSANLWAIIQQQIPDYAVVRNRFSDYFTIMRGNNEAATGSSGSPDSLLIVTSLLAYEKRDFQQVKTLLDNYSGANQRRVGYLRALACLQTHDWKCAQESAEVAAASTMYKAEANWLKLLAELGSGKDIRTDLNILIEKQSPYAANAKELLLQLDKK